MERSDDTPAEQRGQTAGREQAAPPGEFVCERLLADCERFLREARRLSEARNNVVHPLTGSRSR